MATATKINTKIIYCCILSKKEPIHIVILFGDSLIYVFLETHMFFTYAKNEMLAILSVTMSKRKHSVKNLLIPVAKYGQVGQTLYDITPSPNQNDYQTAEKIACILRQN